MTTKCPHTGLDRPLEAEMRLKSYRRDGSVRAEAIVDADTYAWASKFRWYVSGPGYFNRAKRVNGKRHRYLLHREILGLEIGDPLRGDHINRDPLDNRRENLRVATQSQNAQNCNDKGGTSRHRGVSRVGNGWRAHGTVNGKFHHLGKFENEEDAAAVAAAFRKESMTHAPEGEVAADADRSRGAGSRLHWAGRTYSINSLYAYCRKHGHAAEAKALTRYRGIRYRETGSTA